MEAPVPAIVETNMDNIESHENIAENTLEVDAVVPIEVVTEAPKVVKKRAPKKKAEAPVPAIVEPIIENHEETLSYNNDNNAMDWFDEQAKQIALRREPILATFAETPQELVEELYDATITQHTHHHNIHIDDNTAPYGNLQPIADIVSETLENDDDYTEQIMVETFEFNGQMYWIDAQNRVLDYETFEHIGQYDDVNISIRGNQGFPLPLPL